MTTKNFDKEVKESDGTIYLEPKATGMFTASGQQIFAQENGIIKTFPVTFATIIANLLRNSTRKESLTSDEHIEQWSLQKKISSGGDIALSGEQISIIRELVTKSRLAPFIIGQICSYLNEQE